MFFHSRSDKVVGASSLLFATCADSAALQSYSKVGRAVSRMGEIPKGLIFLSGPMNKPLAGCQLQWVAGERLPSLPGDQADDYPVGEQEGKKKAPVISCGQGMCSSAERSLSASSRRQLDSISGSASPVGHIISPWFQQQKNVHEEGGKAVAEKNANGR